MKTNRLVVEFILMNGPCICTEWTENLYIYLSNQEDQKVKHLRRLKVFMSVWSLEELFLIKVKVPALVSHSFDLKVEYLAVCLTPTGWW